ncbi:NAD(P)H-dependent glycerol-3-phosphate dehydrogenase [Pseudoruegeria sp. SHC-113]|uniref:NAD(P)H-dependent glycerol-3-phosphate dehydrogenase n=1 Tax=Pseudoruegeria sp. SHC-113 TaxID=2855439 RepID=UPI0021BAF34C|nr:NAD(P)H-dependent glycerol-3-phosphate dehydrogenase [Pseudoruegeria sp. SHC-113]MCT8158615.1 NAD(P)-dependent glycerol-3-phosphate dehydrogenase [Pseudoruegeria sp. SHC-113]
MSIAVLGAGAFGTALAITIARGGTPVTLWARDAKHAAQMQATRENARRLAGVSLPQNVTVTAEIASIEAGIALLAVPMQQIAAFLAEHGARLAGKPIVACCKGVDLQSGFGPTATIAAACPTATPAVLTGPSFAIDIARGLPTALTLACGNEAEAQRLQAALSTDTLRLYRTTDTTGAELGGALKNVIAIACGVTIGAGLGESARAAVMTRGFAEMQRLSQQLGARPETLAGLSGFGDLALTCTSEKSRNFSFGLALGRGESFDAGKTVEGAATARAVARLAREAGAEMPITSVVAAVLEQKLTIREAVDALLSRPLKEE